MTKLVGYAICESN